tara:strand:+ start:6691 stop:7083 length:393 start_codon:yes stop_codon:yes gene_type:complete
MEGEYTPNEVYDFAINELGMTEEDLANVLRDYEGEGAILQQQMAMADAMKRKQPEGTYAGGMYVAPNIMSNIGAGLSSIAGSKMGRDTLQSQRDLASKKQEGLAAALGRRSNIDQYLANESGTITPLGGM